MFGKRFCLNDCYPEDGEIIYRYMYLWKFMHIVGQRKLYLSRGDQFKDSLEGKETERSRKIRKKVHDQASYKENSELYDRNRRCVAISCWYTGNTESRKMWEKFAPGPADIAVRSTVSRLKKALFEHKDKLCIRKVEYIENHKNKFTKFGCPFYPFSIKAYNRVDAYRVDYESEIRVIYGDGKACKDGSPLYNAPKLVEAGVELTVDPSILIDTVILSPEAPDCFLNSIQTLICCLNINLKVKNSTLKKE